MELAKTRWLNARLLHVFFGDQPYTALARYIGKDNAVIQKWFNRKSFIKPIGDKAARDIERICSGLIKKNTDTHNVSGWMDSQHHRLWAMRLQSDSNGERLKDVYTTTEIAYAIEHVLSAIESKNAVVAPVDVSILVVKMLPVLSDDDLRQIIGTHELKRSADKIINSSSKDPEPH